MAKPAALYFWCAVGFINFVTNQLEAVYSQERPYWLYEEITSEECLLAYGNPCAHVLINSFILITLYLHQYYEVGVQEQKMNVFCTAYIIKMAVTAALLCFFVFLSFSQIYLGASFLNQALFGLSLGVVLAFIGHYKVKPAFLDMPESAYSNVGGSSFQATYTSYCITIVLAFLAPLGMIFTLYYLKVTFDDQDVKLHTDPSWRKVLLLSECDEREMSMEASLQHLHVLKSSRVMLGFGAIFGQYFEWQFFVNTGDLRTSHWTW